MIRYVFIKFSDKLNKILLSSFIDFTFGGKISGILSPFLLEGKNVRIF